VCPVAKRTLVLATVLALFTGCNGGTVDRHALTNDAATIDSVACEGMLLAHDVARGKSTSYFAREQAAALSIQSSNLADALASRPALAAIEPKVRTKAKVAGRLAAILRRLHDHPSDEHAAARIETQLKSLGGCA
jgi:hypothetical protein